MTGLRVLAVDDEKLARDDLSWLLNQAEGVAEVITADCGEAALRILNERHDIDGLFLDVQMPGLDGVEIVKVLRHFRDPPAIAFVTAFDQYAVDAFDLEVCDYLRKPVDQERLDETLRRMRDRRAPAQASPVGASESGALPRLVGKLGNDTFTIQRDDVVIVEAQGDYVRVTSDDGSHLVRESISSLTSAWAAHGFLRIHRSFLVRASAISGVRNVDGRRSVQIGDRELPVSRRYTRLLQDHFGGSL